MNDQTILDRWYFTNHIYQKSIAMRTAFKVGITVLLSVKVTQKTEVENIGIYTNFLHDPLFLFLMPTRISCRCCTNLGCVLNVAT